MNEQLLKVQTEPGEDLPILIAKLERMKVRELAERHFMPHGNRQGCSLGTVMTIWLTYILSEGDHRLSEVQEWVAAWVNTLGLCLKTRIRPEDFSDDRLAIALNLFGADRDWRLFESALTQGVIRIHALKGNLIRLDSPSGRARE